ncbi:methyltransferase [Candidatus Dojkabacteria bacterium]|nr:methyltransferase [Candidatus Dojkabacteria bacterium]
MRHKWHVDNAKEFEEREKELLKKYFQNQEPTIKGNIHITAGKVKNFALEIPHGTRPATSRIRTRVFDILGQDIYKKRILDLYAGTGAFGLESLSRGASEAVFVDASKSAEKILLNNIKKTGFLTETEIFREKVTNYLTETASDEDEAFDIIFMDPPYKLYNTKDTSKINQIIDLSGRLLPGVKDSGFEGFKGALIIKHPRKYDLSGLDLSPLRILETLDFGLNSVSILIVTS